MNVGKPGRPGRHEAIGDAEFPAERDALGFLREDGIRSTVDDEIAHVFAHDDAAGPRRAFEKDERPALFLQLEGGAEPGDAAANDDDVDDVDGVDRVRHASAPTIDSSAAMNVGDVFSDSVRRSAAPASRAAFAAWTSMSNRISV